MYCWLKTCKNIVTLTLLISWSDQLRDRNTLKKGNFQKVHTSPICEHSTFTDEAHEEMQYLYFSTAVLLIYQCIIIIFFTSVLRFFSAARGLMFSDVQRLHVIVGRRWVCPSLLSAAVLPAGRNPGHLCSQRTCDTWTHRLLHPQSYSCSQSGGVFLSLWMQTWTDGSADSASALTHPLLLCTSSMSLTAASLLTLLFTSGICV